jgi:hypothetical protein
MPKSAESDRRDERANAARLRHMNGRLAPPHELTRARGEAGAEQQRPLGGLLAKRLAALGEATAVSCAIAFADGTRYRNQPHTPPAFTIRFNTARAERRVILFGHVGLLESYFDGSVDVDGDLQLRFRAAFDAGLDNDSNALVALRNRWHEFRFSNRSIAQARQMRAFTTGWANRSTSSGSTASA